MEELVQQLLFRLERLEEKRHFFAAKWVSAESVDSDLSIIDTVEPNEIFETSQLRFIPKLDSVGTPAVGDTVICSRNPVIIYGVLKGDINLASED